MDVPSIRRITVNSIFHQVLSGSYHFLAHGGCGRNGMKDSVKFLIPPGNSKKNC